MNDYDVHFLSFGQLIILRAELFPTTSNTVGELGNEIIKANCWVGGGGGKGRVCL